MAKGKTKIDIEKCKGCELCIVVCPEGILEMSKAFNKAGVPYPVCIDKECCTACTSCAIICPEAAITVWRFSKKRTVNA